MISLAMGMRFFRKGGRAVRMQQWWGNKEDGLVLKVHMGKKIDSYVNYG